jgi:hypothetical protein
MPRKTFYIYSIRQVKHFHQREAAPRVVRDAALGHRRRRSNVTRNYFKSTILRVLAKSRVTSL